MAGRNFQAGFVAFHGDEGLFSGNSLAHLHQNFDDGDIGEIADIGHDNLNFSHKAFLLRVFLT